MSTGLNGLTQYFTASAPLNIEPLTFVSWVLPTTINNGAIVDICQAGGGSKISMRQIDNKLQVATVATSTALAITTTTFTTGVWNHATAIFASRSFRRALLNGTNSATDTANAGAFSGTLDTLLLGARMNTTPGLLFTGSLAETAVYNVALSDDDVRMLARGFSPRKVRPQNLVFYVPGIRTVQDIRGGIQVTGTGGPTVTDHPRIYY